MHRLLFFLAFCILPLIVSAQAPQWASGIGSPTGDDVANVVKVAPNGNVLVAGHYRGTMDLDPSTSNSTITSYNNSQDMFLACYSNAGNFIWGFSLGQEDYDDILALAIDNANNVFIGGYFRGASVDFDPSPSATANLSCRGFFGGSASNFGGDGFVAKYSSTGAYQWAFIIGTKYWIETVESLATDAAGNIFVGGQFKDMCDFDPSPGVAMLNGNVNGVGFIAKYSGAGAYQWAWNYGKSGIAATDNGIWDIAVDANGDAYLAGVLQAGTVSDFDPSPANTVTITSNGGYDALLAKYTSSGSLVFAQNIGGPGTDVFSGICLDAVGDIYVTGYTESSNIDFDPTPAVAQGALANAGAENIMVVKYSNSGKYQWGKLMGNSAKDMGTKICFSGSNIYCTGSFSNSTDFNPGGTPAIETSNGSNDIYWVSYDPSGNYKCSFNVGSGQSDIGQGIANEGKDFYMAGAFSGNGVDFDPGAPAMPLSSTGAADAYIASYRWTCDTTGESTHITSNITQTSCDSPFLYNGKPITQPGVYRDTFKTAGGKDSIVVLTLTFGSKPVADFDFSPLTATGAAPTIFINKAVNSVRYLWEFGDSSTSEEIDPSHQYTRSGTYNVCLKAYGEGDCFSIKCKTLISDIEPIIGVPTGFSPNGDGRNDILYVRGSAIAEFVLRIYNRWGQTIFETTSMDTGWDGSYKGAIQGIDVVAYTLHATFIDGTIYQKAGNITIIR